MPDTGRNFILVSGKKHSDMPASSCNRPDTHHGISDPPCESVSSRLEARQKAVDAEESEKQEHDGQNSPGPFSFEGEEQVGYSANDKNERANDNESDDVH